MIRNIAKWVHVAGLAAVVGLVGCAESNESAAKIEGTEPTTGAKGAAAPPKSQAEYAQQYGSSGRSQYGGQGYPGAN